MSALCMLILGLVFAATLPAGASDYQATTPWLQSNWTTTVQLRGEPPAPPLGGAMELSLSCEQCIGNWSLGLRLPGEMIKNSSNGRPNYLGPAQLGTGFYATYRLGAAGASRGAVITLEGRCLGSSASEKQGRILPSLHWRQYWIEDPGAFFVGLAYAAITTPNQPEIQQQAQVTTGLLLSLTSSLAYQVAWTLAYNRTESSRPEATYVHVLEHSLVRKLRDDLQLTLGMSSYPGLVGKPPTYTIAVQWEYGS